MTKVLFVQGAAERGGAERVLLTLARHLPERGYEPVVCCCADGPFVDELRHAGIAVVQGPPLPRVRQVRHAAKTVAALTQVMRAAGADVVQANGERVAAFSGWAARRAGVRSLHWLHDAPLRSAASAAVQIAMIASPHDAAVAGSAWMARSFRTKLGMRVETIRNGVDLSALPSVPADISVLTGWPKDSLVVACVGRLQRWKGVDVFIRAAAQAARRNPKARFLVVGGPLYGWEEPYAADLPALADSEGLGDRIHFTGHREDALALMAGSDVVVHCSRRPEPLGMVVAEAMALGRAVIATRTRGPEEMISSAGVGMLVAPDDPAALAGALADLLADPTRRLVMGRDASAEVARNWSGQGMAQGFAALYRRLGAA